MSIFALVDCNNFYVSCQRVFDPKLQNRPVVVLSNNDGCIISRSNEAKQLGIPMGAPYFQYRALCEKNKVAVFSSNYELYGDMSQRVMTSLRHFCSDIEVYSVDEAFLRLDSIPGELNSFCTTIREKTLQWTGIPVCIGIGPSKTLAKAANYIAKKQKISSGVLDLTSPLIQDAILSQLEVNHIWGVGHQLTSKLQRLGITTAQHLRDSPPSRIRKLFGVTLERTLWELRGIACQNLEKSKMNKNIISSRSFGKSLTKLADLEEAISHYAGTACAKLRKQQAKAQGIYVFLENNLFDTHDKPYKNGVACGLSHPSADTRLIIQTAKRLLKRIYLPYLNYKKAGIMLMDILPDNIIQNDLLIDLRNMTKQDLLMQTIDAVNKKMGRQSLFIAAEGVSQEWKMRAHQKSGRFTTQWSELLSVKA